MLLSDFLQRPIGRLHRVSRDLGKPSCMPPLQESLKERVGGVGLERSWRRDRGHFRLYVYGDKETGTGFLL